MTDILVQAARTDSVVLAVVRNAAKSTHLQAVIKDLKNVHVLEADVTDYKTLEVTLTPDGPS